MHDKKQFNWEFCKEIRHPLIYEFFKKNYKNHVTEETYVNFIASIPRDGVKYASKKYSPSSARSEYRSLKEKFGFFPS